MKRADIIVARLPHADGSPGKVRPGIVVQCDQLNRQLQSTLVAVITSNTKRVEREPTQFLIDPSTSEGASSGLSYPSAVKCENISTIRQDAVVDVLGRLSDDLIEKLDECLKAALEL